MADLVVCQVLLLLLILQVVGSLGILSCILAGRCACVCAMTGCGSIGAQCRFGLENVALRSVCTSRKLYE